MPGRADPHASQRRRAIVAAAGVAVCGVAALGLALGQGAHADAPAASAGRVMRVLYVVRYAAKPPPPTNAPLLPTVPPDAVVATLDPVLESVQAVADIRELESAQARDYAREARAFDAATRRAYAAADDTLRALPRWPEPEPEATPWEPEQPPREAAATPGG